MKLLLGATVALLIGALAWSWKGMEQGVRDTPRDTSKRLQEQIDELNFQVERLQKEKQLRELRETQLQQTAPVPQPVAPTATAVEDLKAQLAEREAALQALSEEKDKADRKADNFREEAGQIAQREAEKHDQEGRRARLITQALLKARVKEYVEDPQTGAFTIVEILMPDQVNVGDILAIRKNSGLLGQVKVTEITPEGAIASILPGFGIAKPQAGDELITPPEF